MYRQEAASRSDVDRMAVAGGKEKTGVFTGAYAINPTNGEQIPIWIADYVLMGYGTGAIMAVPAHDLRDWAFARQFNLPIRPVVEPPEGYEPTSEETGLAYEQDGKTYFPFAGAGTSIHCATGVSPSRSSTRPTVTPSRSTRASCRGSFRRWRISRPRRAIRGTRHPRGRRWPARPTTGRSSTTTGCAASAS